MGCTESRHRQRYISELKTANISAHCGVYRDARLPLDDWQKFYLQKSWKTIARNLDKAAIVMFLKLLHDNPDIKANWKELRDMSEADVMTSPYVKYLGERMFDTLDLSIDSLDNLDNIIPILKKLGQMHADETNITPEDMWKIEEPFLAAVQACLEERYTVKYQEIYSSFIIFIIETIVIGFDPH